ncbi:hypothetical protein ALC57_16984 [Trachymyrmex cornetzi]|uniref:Uncharacterized protein n=1 Tax=Trachymyrmex cornetzi TaxID=471704 RepID=A0A151IU06_9HYME|nr:hypothetical protein ALC57_16984 [Trachymyrmex cornetzi]
MVIHTYLKEDFEWWIRIFSDTRQANTIRTDLFRCEIYSDASLTGWGLIPRILRKIIDEGTTEVLVVLLCPNRVARYA